MPNFASKNKDQIKCFIAGGAGFVGYHLSNLLLEQDCFIYCLDNFSPQREAHYKELGKSSSFQRVKQKPEEISSNNYDGIDYVFNLIGSETHLNGYDCSLQNILKNGFYTPQLLELAKTNHAKFLLVTTDSLHQNFIFSQEDQNQNAIIQVALDFAEKLTADFILKTKLDARIVRLAYLYGPQMDLNSNNFITKIIRDAINDKKINLPQDGMELIFPTYITDAVLGLVKSIFTQSSKGKIYTLVNNDPITLLNAAYTVQQESGLNFEINFDKQQELKLKSISESIIDSQKSLVWYPRTDFPSGIKKTVDYFIQTEKIIPQPKALNTLNDNFPQPYLKSFTSKAESSSQSLINEGYSNFNPEPSLENNLNLKKTEEVPFFSGKSYSSFPKETHDNNFIKEIKKTESSNSLGKQNSVFITNNSKLETPIPLSINPSVVNSSFLQRLKLLKPNFSSFKKIPKPRISHQILYFLVPLFLFFFLFILPSLYLSKNAKSQTKLFSLVTQSIDSGEFIQAKKQLNKSKLRLVISNKISPIIYWQNNILNKNLSSANQNYLKLTTRQNNYYEVKINYIENLISLKETIFSIKNQDINSTYQSCLSSLSQLYNLLAYLEIEIPQITESNNIEIFLEKENFFYLNQSNFIHILPAIVSFSDRKYTLILFQDNLELRPTGGFIAAAGILTTEKGKITNLEIKDIYELESQFKGSVVPPEEFKKYNLENSWFFRDINFSPSFSCSSINYNAGQHCTAGDAIWFAKKIFSQTPDSAISLNYFSFQNLLSSLGEIPLSQYNELISSENILEKAKSHAQTNQNEFMLALSQEVFTKLKEANPAQLAPIIDSFTNSLEQKNTLLYYPQSSLQPQIENLGWAGSLRQSPNSLLKFGAINVSDYLAIYESNFNFRKNNYYLEEEIFHNLNISSNGELAITSTFNIKNTATTQTWPAGNYDKNYLRFLIPKDSSLKSITINGKALTTQQIDRKDEDPYRSIGFLVSTPIQSSSQIKLVYSLKKTLPVDEASSSYALYIQKQPGSANIPLNFSINYPPDFKLEKISPNADLSSNSLQFSTILDTDKVFAISFSR